MRRVTLVTAIVFGTFVFLGISFLLARALTGPGAERDRVLDVVRAEARREGPLTGGGVELLAISKPIAGEASCG